MKKLLFILSLFLFAKAWTQQPRLVLPIGHTMKINSIAFSPAGTKLLSASADGSAKLWDVNSGALLATMNHKSAVFSAVFSPDGKKILTASLDSTAKVWETNSGKLLATLKEHKGFVFSAVFNPSGNKILTASFDNTAAVWDTQTGKIIRFLQGHTDDVNTVAFSPDGQRMLTGSSDKTAKLWNAAGDLIADLKGHDSIIHLAKFTPDGNFIITASYDKHVKVWDAETGEFITDLFKSPTEINDLNFGSDGSTGLKVAIAQAGVKLFDLQTKSISVVDGRRIVESAVFDPQGKKIIMSYLDGTVKIWNAAANKLLLKIDADEEDRISKAIFSPDGKVCATASGKSSIKIWDANNGELVAALANHTKMVTSIKLSPDGSQLVTTANDDNSIKLWSAKTLKPIGNFIGHQSSINSMQFSNDGNRLLSASTDSTIKLWDIKTQRLIKEFARSGSEFCYAAFSPDNKTIVTTDDGTARVWNSTTGTLLHNLKVQTGKGISAVYNPIGKTILTTSTDSTIKIWDAVTGNFLYNLKKFNNYVRIASFSPDGTKIIIGSILSTITALDTKTANILYTLDGNIMGEVIFNPGGTKIFSAGYTSKIYDAQTGQFLLQLKGKPEYVTSAIISPDGQYLFTASLNNMLQKWNFNTGEMIGSFFSLDSTDYFIQIPSGHYQSTQNASKLLHYVTDDLKVIGFDQLDIKNNRPDLVQAAVNKDDSNLIKSYYNAYIKRIKKLNIDTTTFAETYFVPEVNFVNRQEISSEQTRDWLKVRLQLSDKNAALDRFNIMINEVPLYGSSGFNFQNRNIHFFDTTLFIYLSKGKNKIEPTVINIHGTESFRQSVWVIYNPTEVVKEKMYFIGMGINAFADSRYNLQYSVKDIRDLAIELKNKHKGNIEIDTLFNENISKDNIAALKKKLLQTSINDRVIIAYSGHGLLSRELDYYLSTYRINFNSPEEYGIPYEALEGLLDSIPARKKLMLIDACHSGEVDKEEEVQMNTTASAMGLSKGLKPLKIAKKQLGLTNSFELMQNLFVNVGKSTGAVIISAAAGTQFALERKDLKNGVFTYSILEYLKQQPQVSISSLKNYVNKRVIQLTNGLQVPTTRADTKSVDWKLW